MGLRLLCLTDHTTHNETNSFYRLAQGLLQDERVESLWLATHGWKKNEAFFKGTDSLLHAISMGPDFGFSPGHLAWQGATTSVDINDFDGIVLRVPRTVSDTFFEFLEHTYLWPDRIVNRPSGILKVSSKAFLTEVAQWCPPLALVHNRDEIIRFYNETGPLVLKPLKDYGGRGVVRLSEGMISDGRREVALAEWIREIPRTHDFPMLAMKYLRRVTEGDKRIIVANRSIIGASLRKPPKGTWLCNVAQGGVAEISQVAPEEKEIASALSENLMGYGVVLFGFDTLVNDDGKRVLSEINALSPGGIWPAEQQTGQPLTERTARAIIDYIMTKM